MIIRSIWKLMRRCSRSWFRWWSSTDQTNVRCVVRNTNWSSIDWECVAMRMKTRLIFRCTKLIDLHTFMGRYGSMLPCIDKLILNSRYNYIIFWILLKWLTWLGGLKNVSSAWLLLHASHVMLVRTTTFHYLHSPTYYGTLNNPYISSSFIQ